MSDAVTELGPRTRAVIEGAHLLAQERAVPYVGTEHLLIALTQVPGTVAARVIADLIDTAELVRRVDQALGELQRERFNGAAERPLATREELRAVVDAAQREARLLDDNHVGTEHLLLAAVGLGLPPSLRDLVTRDNVLAVLIDEPGTSPPGFIPLTPRALRVLSLAADRKDIPSTPAAVVAALADEEAAFLGGGVDGPTHLHAATRMAGLSIDEVRAAI